MKQKMLARIDHEYYDESLLYLLVDKCQLGISLLAMTSGTVSATTALGRPRAYSRAKVPLDRGEFELQIYPSITKANSSQFQGFFRLGSLTKGIIAFDKSTLLPVKQYDQIHFDILYVSTTTDLNKHTLIEYESALGSKMPILTLMMQESK